MRSLALAAALVVAASLASASPALASDSISCQFSGLVGALVPPAPGLLHDPALAGSIETGIYHMGATATCVKVDGDLGQAANSGVFNVTIVSDGHYANGACGITDWFQTSVASDTKVTSSDPRWEGPLQFNYIIRDVGTHGVIQIQDAAMTGDITRFSGDGQGAGWTNVFPTGGSDCVETDAAFFQLNGAFSVEV
ncbi:MAG: hypothetical protein ACJ76Z_03300 [Thermoleophilaceae bacterium]